MKTRILTAIALSFTLTARAQVPGIISYQGRIVDNGTNFNGTGLFRFALINNTGTTNYWSNDGTAVGQPALAVSLTVNKGLYSVLLGDTTLSNMTVAIPATTFTNADVRLRAWFNDSVHGFQQLSPDQRIAALGYAMMAATVPNGAITAAQLASNAVTAASLAPGAVTAAAIANGAVGANQLASNSVNSLIQSSLAANGVLTPSATNTANLAANGVLVNGMGNYSVTNQYYLMAAMTSTNVSGGWWDIWGLFLAASADGTNFAWTGPEPVMGYSSPIGTIHYPVNDPIVWLSTNNGVLFYSYSPEPDTPSNSLTIYTAANPTSAPVQVVTIDFSNLVGDSLTNMWLEHPQVDKTPGIIPTNLFVTISTNHTASWAMAATTCTNAPAYTLWTTPAYVSVTDSNGNAMPVFVAQAFSYHGTNMVLFTPNAGTTSMYLATNTTTAVSAYTVWKTTDWGSWLTNGAWSYVGGAPCVTFLSDRIRGYTDVSDANGIPIGTHYSDCFDDWQTWTTPTRIPPPLLQGTTNHFLRMACVIPVPPTNNVWTTLPVWLGALESIFNVPGATGLALQGTLSASGGFTDATGSNITSWTQVGTGITNGNTAPFENNGPVVVNGDLTVSNRVLFGGLVQRVVPITTNAIFTWNRTANCFVYCDTTANIVSNIFLGPPVIGQIAGWANIGSAASNHPAIIDFGTIGTLTNSGSRYLSIYPGQHIIVQRISSYVYASLADNVFGGLTTKIPILNASTNASTLYFTNGFFKGMSTP